MQNKKGKKSIKQILAALLCAVVFIGIFLCFYLFLPKRQRENSSGAENPFKNDGMSQIIPSDDVTVLPPKEDDWKREVRGVWVATVNNIDFPSAKGLGSQQLKNEIDSIINTCTKTGINTIYFQVRPSSDALYQSKIYPVSMFLTGEQGRELPDGFDPLAYIIEKAHLAEIELHAWINPYRVTSSEKITLDSLSKSNPAILHPEWVVKCNNKYYFNPGIPEVRQLVVDGVAELINKYKVDGIHFDDYFYPDVNFDDQATFETFKGNCKTIEEWRLKNNNLLIKAVYEKIKSINKKVQFGIAPMGIWANKSTMQNGSETKGGESYTHNYADTLKWVNDKIIDYICPQLYWTDQSTVSNFNTLVDWWSKATKDTGVDLLIGHALYKLGDKTYPDFNSCDVITNQLKLCRKAENYKGSIFYNYNSLNSNKLNIKNALTGYYSVENTSGLSLTFPEDKTSVEAGSIWMSGKCNPQEELYINNTLVNTVSFNGYFSFSVPLSKGANTINLKNGKQVKSVTVTRTLPKSANSGIFEIFPDDNNIVRYSGGSIELFAIAPENSEMTAVLNNTTVALMKDTEYANTKDKTRYKGIFSLPVTDTEINLGKATFTAKLSGGKTVAKTSKTDILVKPANQIKAGRLIKNSWLRPVSSIQNFLSSFRGFAGFTDYIVAEEYIFDKKEPGYNTFVQFKSGFWTQKSNVETIGENIQPNTIDTISVRYTSKNTNLEIMSNSKNPIKVEVSDNNVVVYLYNCEVTGQFTKLEKNPLFSKATVNKGNGFYLIELTLKKVDGYLGNIVSYTDNKIQVQFRNPCKIINAQKPLKGITIALDPGHGAKTGAACPDGTNERELNFKFVKKIEKFLKSYGANTYLSRSEESNGLETVEVPNFYTEISPDLAVSIHHNSVGYESKPLDHSGFECYYGSAQSKMAAQIIYQHVADYANRKIGNCFNMDYTVSRVREFPSVLLELGYLSNIYEYSWLSDENNSDLYAKSIAVSIVDYFKWQNEFYNKN